MYSMENNKNNRLLLKKKMVSAKNVIKNLKLKMWLSFCLKNRVKLKQYAININILFA